VLKTQGDVMIVGATIERVAGAVDLIVADESDKNLLWLWSL